MMNDKETKQHIVRIADRASITLAIIALMVALALTLGGCDKKEESEYYRPTETPDRPPLENQGQVIVTPPQVPTAPGQPAPPPAPITIVDKDGRTQEIMPGQPTDVEAGTYVMTTVTTPAGSQALPPGCTIVPATPQAPGSITVAPISSGGTGTSGGNIGILPPLPEILAGTNTMIVTPDDVTTGTIALAYMTREVVLQGVLQGLDPAALSAAMFTLEGVLNTRRFDQPFATALPVRGSFHADGNETGASTRTSARAAEIHAAQTLFTIAADGTFTARVRLLGIDLAATQQLRLTLMYTDTTVAPYVYTADVSPLLVDFNTGAASQPVYLQAALSFGLGGVVGTITGWTPAPPQNLPGE